MLEKIRVSYGSAVVLGLIRGRLDAEPTTLYILFKGRRCRGRCAFCPQSEGDPAHVSRVEWPEFGLRDVISRARSCKGLQRVCVQCTDEPVVRRELPFLVSMLKTVALPISVSTPPLTKRLLVRVKDAGAGTVTVPLDCADRGMSERVKGRSSEAIMKGLRDALEVFGWGNVGTHIIVGLGETEEQVAGVLTELAGMGVVPSLFAFTPVKGTPMEGAVQPNLATYRRLQVARHIIVEKWMKGSFEFDEGGKIVSICGVDLELLLKDGTIFTVRGCPGCNRPFYNERASGPFYNYPNKPEKAVLERIAGEIIGSLAGN